MMCPLRHRPCIGWRDEGIELVEVAGAWSEKYLPTASACDCTRRWQSVKRDDRHRLRPPKKPHLPLEDNRVSSPIFLPILRLHSQIKERRISSQNEEGNKAASCRF